MAGFEPASQGVKVPCLTTWLHLNISWADFGTVCRFLEEKADYDAACQGAS